MVLLQISALFVLIVKKILKTIISIIVSFVVDYKEIGKFRTSSTEDGTSQTIESRLANKTKKLENELKTGAEH